MWPISCAWRLLGPSGGDTDDRDALAREQIARGRQEPLVVVDDQAVHGDLLSMALRMSAGIAASRNFASMQTTR